MAFFRTVALAAAAVIGITSALPSETQTGQTWVPYTQNNTREFYIHMVVTDGPTTYQEWSLEAYHTGAGLADPVFAPNTTTPAFLNGTNLQFDVGDYPFSVIASEGDTNYARWEPVTIEAGYGSGNFANDGPNGIILTDEEYDGWIVCEWFHSDNAPQLFRMIKGFDTVAGSPYTDIPCSCSRVLLFPEWI